MTAGAVTPQRRATSRLDLPSPDSNTICARHTSECGMLCERTIARNCSRSASLIPNAVLGLPILATSLITVAGLMPHVKILMGHYTSSSMKIREFPPKLPSWVSDRLFGYDFFISYSHRDGEAYAKKLAAELRRLGYA